MAEERAQRRLAAILAADVVGYSRMMGVDEVGTLTALKAWHKDVVQPLMTKHNGRVVKLMGDGLLAEFASAVNAVEYAVEMQEAMATAYEEVPEERKIVLRVGINLGDVIVEGSDLYGDGVNVAARLEAMAEPGGICVSDDAHRQVRDKLAIAFEDAGEHQLKNIARPMRIFRVRSGTKPLAPRPSPGLPDKPSLAVLPFKNLSAEGEQDFFADGLTEDLITELSKAPGLFVIASHSSFAFKNSLIDVRRVAQELGVRYILEGSARRAAGRIRINAQLIDAREGGGHLWAERYDRELADVFALQDEVVSRIVEALVGRLAVSKLPDRKPPKSVEAYDLFVRGRLLFQRTSAREGKEARHLFQRAIAVDAGYAEAHAYLAFTHLAGWVHWFEPVEPHRRLAMEIARHAVALDPNGPFARAVLGYVLGYEREYEESAIQLEMALRLDPNHADTYTFRSDLLVMEGRPPEAVASATTAMRLNPHPPSWYYWIQGEAEYAARQYENAVATLRREVTYGTPSRAILAAALAQLGRIEEASFEGRLFMAKFPSFRIGEFLATQPFRHEADREHFAEGYRKAALPET